MKKLLPLIIALLIHFAASAGSNVLKIHDATASAGENININLEIINDDPFVAFQTDIALPVGFGYMAGSIIFNPARRVDHLFNAAVLPGTNVLRLIAFSLTNANFIGNSGIVATFTLATPSNGSGAYVLSPENTIIGNVQGENIVTGTIQGTITLYPSFGVSVCFVLRDSNNNLIPNATITFCGITNPPGQYCFTGVPGSYCVFTIQIPGGITHSGSMVVPNQNITVNVFINTIPQNILKLHNAYIPPGGSGTLNIEIINDDAFVGFQFDLALPQGFQYQAGSIALNPDRKVDHIIQAAVLPGTNVLRVISFSLTNAQFLGNSGIIASFTVTTPTSGGVFGLNFENAIIGNAQGQNIITGTVSGTITLIGGYYVVEFIIKDVNQVPIPGATITLCNTVNQPGNYLIMLPNGGWCNYQVKKNGYFTANGSIYISSGFSTVNVTLEALPTYHYILTINDVIAPAGEEIDVEIEIWNSDIFTGFQTDIPLSPEFEYIPGSASLNPARITDHILQAFMVSGTNIFRAIASSPSNAGFTGTTGVAATFALATQPIPGSYPLLVQNAGITGISGNNLITGTFDGVVTLLDPIIEEFDVNFIVLDQNNMPVGNATIKLGVAINAPGNYTFQQITPGVYNYMITSPGFLTAYGSVEVIDEDVTVTVVLEETTVSGNVLKINDVSTEAGNNITVTLEIFNQNPFVSFQLDIPLPLGFDFIPGSFSLNPLRANDHVFQAAVLPGSNVFRAITYSAGNNSFWGNSGEIASFTLTTPFIPGTYTLDAENAIIANSNGTNIITGTIGGTVTLSGTVYTVTFVIKDQNQQPVSGAEVTLGMLTNPAGNYVFPNLSPGTYGWTVAKEGYISANGSVTVTDQDVTVNVTLNAVPGENIMKVRNACYSGGLPVNINIEIINADPFVGFQFDMPLPTGIGYVSGSIALNPARIVDHIIQGAVLPGTNVFRAISFSLTNTAYLGNSGIIATYTLTTPNVPGIYAMNLDNAIIGNAQGANIITGVINGSLIFGCYYLVQFVVQDINQVPIPGATITLGNVTGQAGNYYFQISIDSSGVYNYQVTKSGYFPATGSVLVNNNLTVPVTLQQIPANYNVMKFNNTTATAGQPMWLDLEIINTDSFAGFQHDVSLHTGFTYVAGSAVLNPDRITDHVINAAMLPGTNVLRAISYSLTNSNFLGSAGIIASYQLTTPYAAGVYTFTPSNATIANTQGQNILSGIQPGIITLTGGQPYMVTFEVFDQNQVPVPDAAITLGTIVNPPGNYVFLLTLPGNYQYFVQKEGYWSASGMVSVLELQQTVTVTLELIGTNTMILNSPTAVAGQPVPMELEIINENFFTGFGLDIALPVGLTFLQPTLALNPFRITNHTIQGFVLPGTSILRITASSLTNASFLGNSGIIATFNLQSTTTLGVRPLTIINPYLKNAAGQTITTNYVNGTVTLVGVTVTFEVVDQDQNPINDATITFRSVTNPAGNYVFHNIPSGNSNYTVARTGFFNETGQVTVVNQNVTFTVVLELTGENILTVSSASCFPGDTITVGLSVENENAFYYLRADIPRPQGFTLVPGSGVLNPARSVNHTLSVTSVTGSNLLRVITSSSTQTTFLGNSGEVVSFQLVASINPGVYPLDPQLVYLWRPGVTNIVTGTVPGSVTVAGYTVEFDVVDENLSPIPDAVVTFNSIINTPGNYIFNNTGPGNYPWNVAKSGYFPASGVLTVTNQDTLVQVVLTAQQPCIMALSGGTAIAGENVDLDIEITNVNPFVAFQLDLPLPPGFGVVTGSVQLHPDRITNHQINSAFLPATNIYRMVAYSMTNAPFLGNSGIVASLTLTTPLQTGSFTIPIQNAIVGNPTGLNIITETIPGTVTLTGFDVFFSVSDQNQIPITDAVITLGNLTNPPGDYVFENVAPGNYPYSVHKSGYWSASGEVTVVNDDVNVDVTLEAAGSMVMQLAHITTTAGSNFWMDLEIVNENPFAGFTCDVLLPSGFSYAPGSIVLNLARATDHIITANLLPGTNTLRIISLSPTQANFNGNSGAVAHFACVSPMQTGVFTFSVENAFITNSNWSYIIPETQPGTVTLTGYTVTFIIQNDNQVPIDDAVIMLGNTTNPAGNYVFDNLVPGFYDYLIVAPGYKPVSGNVLVSNQNRTVTVTLIEVSAVNQMKLLHTHAIAGESFTLELEIANTNQFVAFQHDIPLPAGFAYVQGSASMNEARKVDHLIEANVMAGTNLFRAISWSLTNTAFAGNEGTIASYTLTAPNTSGVFPLILQEAIIGNATGQNILTGTVNGSVTVNTVGTFTVIFVVKDQNQNPVNGASITLGNTTNPPGNYVFSQVLPGTSNYLVCKAGYEISQGYVEVVDENVTVNVTLQTFSGNQGVMILHNVNTLTGQNAVINIEIINLFGIVGYQLDIPLPPGFGYVAGSAVVHPARSCSHLINGNVLAGTNVLRIISFTLANCGFVGYEGIIGSFTLSTPATPGVYTLNPQNVIIGNGAGQNVLSGIIPGTVTLTSPPSLHSVNFVVQDVNQVPVAGAVVTLGNSTNPAGNYVFHNVPPGTYNYSVQKFGFTNYTGSVDVTDPIETVTVTLTNNGNVMILPHIVATAGDTIVVGLEINNESDFTGFQLDVILPEGFGYVPGSAFLNPQRATNHLIQAAVLPGTNTLRIISFSMYISFYQGVSGVIASFSLTTPQIPGYYDLVITNAIMGHPAAQNIITGTQNGSVTLTPLSYTVNFVVQGIDQQPIAGAAITLGGISNLPGNYVFTNILPGIYPYTVTKADYTPVAGIAEVIDQDLTITVTLLVGGNVMILHPAAGIAGENIQVGLEILNQIAIVGYQLDIILPPGFAYVAGSAAINPLRAPDHLIQANTLPGTNVLRILSFSLTNASLQGNSGIVSSFVLSTPATPGVFALVIENAILGHPAGQNVITGVVNGSVTLLQPVGIAEPEHETVQVFPNPATHTLNIVSDKPLEQVQLFNSNGRQMFESREPGTTSMQINVRHYPAGIYMLQMIKSNGQIQSRKVLVLRN